MNSPSLAFLLVALCYLQPEAAYYADRLSLPCPSLLERTNIVGMQIAGGSDRLAGYLETTNYMFHFRASGHLDYLKRREKPTAELHIREYHAALARQYSEIGADGAYRLGTQWLAAVDVDVALLESKYHHEITYPELDKPVKVVAPDGRTVKVEIVPRFWLTWGKDLERGEFAAQVELLGPSKELVNLTLNEPSLSKRPRLRIGGGLVLNELPNEPFKDVWGHKELSATNVFQILHTSTAYQAVMLRRMIDQGNATLRQLGFPSAAQLRLEDLDESIVVPPQFGFRGYVGRTNCAFQFDVNGKVNYMFYCPPEDAGKNTASLEYYEEKSRKPMLVDSNSVVELATGWLEALGIDVIAMNRVTKPVADWYNFGRNRPSHLWWVTWPEPQQVDRPFAVVVVDGTTKTAQRIRLNKADYAGGSSIAVANADELMRIPDSLPQRHPLMAHLNVLNKAGQQ